MHVLLAAIRYRQSFYSCNCSAIMVLCGSLTQQTCTDRYCRWVGNACVFSNNGAYIESVIFLGLLLAFTVAASVHMQHAGKTCAAIALWYVNLVLVASIASITTVLQITT